MWHHTEEAKEKIRRSRIGVCIPHTEATKRKMSISRMGHIVSAETRRKLRIANKGKPHRKGWHHTEDAKSRISCAESNTRKKWREKYIGRKCPWAKDTSRLNTRESREKRGATRARLILEGKLHPERTSKGGWFYSYKNGLKGGNNIRYRSLLELAWYKIFEKSPKVLWYFPEPIIIPYFWQGIIRNYIPDIRVCYKDKTVELIEIKPEPLWNKSQNLAKWNAAQEWCKTRSIPTKFRVLGYKNLKQAKNL